MLARSKVIERRPKVLRGAAARPGSPRTSSADSYAAAGGRPQGFMLRRGSVEAATVGHRGVAAAELARDQAAERMVAAVGHPQDRKSVVSGQSVPGRFGLGGRRIIKK